MSIEVEIYDCESPCGPGLFCGSDTECHPYSCQNWYQYANRNFTDYDPNIPLKCSTSPSPFPELLNAAVVFGCTGFGGSLPEPPVAVYQPFNRRCVRDDHIMPSLLEATFVCYEMDNETDFQPFIDEASSATIDPCPNSSWYPDVPSFIYQVQVSRDDNVNNYLVGATLDAGNATIEFNSTRALGTMFAQLSISEAPTNSPNATPNSAHTVIRSHTVFAIESSFLLVLVTVFFTRLWK